MGSLFLDGKAPAKEEAKTFTSQGGGQDFFFFRRKGTSQGGTSSSARKHRSTRHHRPGGGVLHQHYRGREHCISWVRAGSVRHTHERMLGA